jgi:hypothetical protein
VVGDGRALSDADDADPEQACARGGHLAPLRDCDGNDAKSIMSAQ